MKPPSAAGERLWVALDKPSLDEALALVERLRGVCDGFKVGLELFAAAGPRAVTEVRAHGGRVFLDLKLHDIPETVRRAAQAAAETGAELLTVHTGGGRAMLEAAVDGARGVGILGVTVLTSLGEGDLRAVGIEQPIDKLVALRAELACAAGCRGVVASPLEAASLRAALGPSPLLVTPGIRPTTGGDDQKRTATVEAAIRAGASAIVVGRPIRDAADPRAAALSFVQQIEEAAG